MKFLEKLLPEKKEKLRIYLNRGWIWISEYKINRKVVGDIGEKKGKALCMGNAHCGNGLDGMSCQLE